MQMTLEMRDGKYSVWIQHREEVITWNVSIFDASNFRGHLEGKYDIFKYNNLFWERLKAETQDNIFNIFKKLKISLENYTERTSLTLELFPLIHDLYEYHKLDDVEHWIKFFTDIQFPPDLQHEYIHSNEKTGTRDQTYLRDDYIKLICLTFNLRLMIPIWGEFIAKTKRDTGTQFKEYYAFQLLNQSHLNDSPAMEKLKTYVYRSIPEERSSGPILGGLSSEDFPIWVMSLVVIRKLCTIDIGGKEDNSSIVPYIYNHVRERVARSDNNFVGVVREKNIIKESTEGTNDKLSRLEGYKIRQEISPGDIVLLEHMMSDITRVAKQICPEIDDNLLNNALYTSQKLLTHSIQEPQITLIQWVFKPVISTRAVLMLSKKTVVAAAGATQAILTHYNHVKLAAIATAYAVENEHEFMVNGVDSRARITKDLQEELNKLFPYHRRSVSKAKNAKNSNQAIQAIESMTDKLSEKNWILTVDEKLLPYITGSETQRQFSLPHEIKNLLANLVITLAKRKRMTIANQQLKMEI